MASVDAIAPCGLNCRLCRAYQRERDPCRGCRGDQRGKPKTRRDCRIRNYDVVTHGLSTFCSSCDSFPCPSLNQLDRRYRSRYGTSPVENLLRSQRLGVQEFMGDDMKRWS